MARTVWVGEVRTGRRITQLPVAGGSWSMVHRDAGVIEVRIPLLASEFARYERDLIGALALPFHLPSELTSDAPVWRPGQGLRAEFLSAVDPARCFLAVLEGDTVLEAGPIWAHSLSAGSTMLTVRAAGLRSLFDHRRVMGVVADGAAAAEWSVTYDGLSLATVAKRLVALAMSHADGDLPIVLPDDETVPAGARTRTYLGYDLGVLGQRLDELMNVEGGPDLALEPRITSDRMGIEWVLRAGTEADPLLHQRSGDWTWDAQVPQGAVHGIGVDVDASGMASRSWVTGEGSQTALLMEWADDDALTSRGYPMLEQVESRHTIQERATAASWAAANLAGQVRPWATWRVNVRADAHPRLGTYRPGDFGRVWVPQDHPYLRWKSPEGFHRARVLSVSGSLESNLVALSLAPGMDVR